MFVLSSDEKGQSELPLGKMCEVERRCLLRDSSQSCLLAFLPSLTNRNETAKVGDPNEEEVVIFCALIRHNGIRCIDCYQSLKTGVLTKGAGECVHSTPSDSHLSFCAGNRRTHVWRKDA